MKSIIFICVISLCTVYSYGQHKKHHPDQHKKEHHNHHQSKMMETPLKQTGSDVFDAIQEVVGQLKADPNTDWSKVDLEGLRQHLIDMKAFTEEVEVIEQTPIDNGIKMLVKPETDRADKALNHMLTMHPKMMKMERGWDMDAQQQGEQWEITCTTADPKEVDLIRGLGYIGILVEGAHHQVHHWMMATGMGHQH